MGIIIGKEPEEFDRFPLEHCFFCGEHTKFWAKEGDVPVCPECSKIHDEEELEK